MGAFVEQVTSLGFKCNLKDKKNQFFLLFEFTKLNGGEAKKTKKLSQPETNMQIAAKPCI